MNKEKINEFKRYTAAERLKLESFTNVEVISKLESFGIMYADWFAKEKALRDIRTHGVRYMSMIDIIKTQLPAESNAKVVEIGCNTGFLSIFFKQTYTNSSVVAIDLSGVQIEVNKILDGSVFKSGVEYVQADGANLCNTVKENTVDLVFLCEILEHLNYMSVPQIDVLKSAVLITKPGGKILVSVPFEDRIPAPGHKTNFTREMLIKLFDTAGVSHVALLDAERDFYGLENHFLFLLTK